MTNWIVVRTPASALFSSKPWRRVTATSPTTRDRHIQGGRVEWEEPQHLLANLAGLEFRVAVSMQRAECRFSRG